MFLIIRIYLVIQIKQTIYALLSTLKSLSNYICTFNIPLIQGLNTIGFKIWKKHKNHSLTQNI